ncbi:hypothetical protein GIB67_036678 [Kingdonia uniflora]|uniref:Uncharacterized protein n=1 Tax=Kingdonia uniflora TaxID=39325 RepID=A0A7J7LWJ4_9MAGN|nr:hypothetical protein GIB67_036678 [Kingdonia uniflora]
MRQLHLLLKKDLPKDLWEDEEGDEDDVKESRKDDDELTILVRIEYWGNGHTLEVSCNFNGWHHPIEMEPNSSSTMGSTESRYRETYGLRLEYTSLGNKDCGRGMQSYIPMTILSSKLASMTTTKTGYSHRKKLETDGYEGTTWQIIFKLDKMNKKGTYKQLSYELCLHLSLLLNCRFE